jgi:nucleoside-diphosphate-sugar epimerase
VTGAGGFIGSQLVPILTVAGFDTVGLYRRSGKANNGLPGGGVRLDINGDTDWGRCLDGIDAIVHLAGLAHSTSQPDDLESYRAINVDGTRNLARHAAVAGVKRFVYLSTIKVHGEESSDRPFSIADEPDPKDAYAVSKLEAERELRKVESETGLEVVIIRPPLVYGPGVKGNLAALIKLIEVGIPIPTGAINNRRDLISAYNLCDCIRTCIDHTDALGRTFLVCDNESLSINDIIRYLSHGMGRRARLIAAPAWLLKSAALVAGRAGQFNKMTSNLQVKTAETARILGWTPPYSVAESFEMMFAEDDPS